MSKPNAIDRLQKAGVRRAEIAAACNVSRAAVSYWATGRSTPQATQMAALVRLAETRGVVLLASDFGPAPEALLPKRQTAAEGAAATNEDSVSVKDAA